MKHRKIVGGPKKKNRIHEVDATNVEDANTSPLESPNVSEDDGGTAGAVQRFLAQRRSRRVDDHRGHLSGVESGSDEINDDDEPDNDSGDEGLAQRKNFLLAGGLPSMAGDLPSKKAAPSARAGILQMPPPESKAPNLPTAFLPMLPFTATTQKTPSPAAAATTTNPTAAAANGGAASATTTNPSAAAATTTVTIPPADALPATSPSLPTVKSSEALSSKAASKIPNAATTTTNDSANNNNNNNTPSSFQQHPLLRTDRTTSMSSEGGVGVSPTTSPHHRPRAPSVTFSTLTTDLESGQQAGTTFPATTTTFNNNNGNATDSDPSDNFFSFFMPRNEVLASEGRATTTSTGTEKSNTDFTPLLTTTHEQTPLLTESRDGSLQPGGIVDLSRATALGNSTDDDYDDDDDLEMGSFHSEADSTVGDKVTTDDVGTSAGTQSMLEQFFEEGTQAVYDTIAEATTEAWEQYDESRHYDWREFWKGGGFLRFCRWLATGMAPETYKQSDGEVQENLNSLARMLSLLREYLERFGMPDVGGGKDQEYVLREVTKDLYLGGSPIWALEPVMKRVAEGLTGKPGVDFFLLPRRAFIFAPSSGATALFRISRGYDMQRLDDMENVAVRLASFASNTSSVASVPARWPKAQEMRRAFRTESLAGCYWSKDEMAEEILSLASDAEGLFFYIRNHQNKCYANRESPLYKKGDESGKLSELGEFWTVEDEVRELFSRLAATEAAIAIDKMDAERKALYSPMTAVMFRVFSSACACAFWFSGSWIDIAVSGVLAELVAMIGSSPILSKQERIIFEAVASGLVGFTAACIALTWPDHCCFGAMAISGVLDLLQGFRVVYSIIELMSRHTVTGGADFLEGVFFTTLIAYCLRFGQFLALETLGDPENDDYLQCNKGISEWWYLLFVPVGAVSWSGLFNPNYFDLPIMAAHGILGYVVSWQFYEAASDTQMNHFLAAMAVTFSAGILSRFTGRQALGNTVAGLYVLLPGAYLVTQVYADDIDGFLWQIILRAIIIGIGGWTGTILCTPTLLGINKGLMDHTKGAPTFLENGAVTDNMSSASSIASGQNFRRRDKAIRKSGTGALLFF